jgi:hypothetical protein
MLRLLLLFLLLLLLLLLLLVVVVVVVLQRFDIMLFIMFVEKRISVNSLNLVLFDGK